MASAVSALAPTRSGKAGASRPPLGASPPVPQDPARRPVQSALPTDPASLRVHPAEEPAVPVEEQPHASPDPLETEADAMADRGAGQKPVEGPAPHYRRYEDDNPIPASALRA